MVHRLINQNMSGALLTIANSLSAFPPEIAVLLVSMTPVLEQRAGIPLAVLIYNMPIWKAYWLVMAGNILPVMALLYFADSFHAWVQKNSNSLFGRTWLNKLKQAQESFHKYEKYGLLGLTFFVVSPLPGSGIFTGAMIAFLMGIPFKHSWPYLAASVMGSGLVTLLIVFGIDKVF